MAMQAYINAIRLHAGEETPSHQDKRGGAEIEVQVPRGVWGHAPLGNVLKICPFKSPQIEISLCGTKKWKI